MSEPSPASAPVIVPPKPPAVIPGANVQAIIDKHKHDVVGRCWAIFHELEAAVEAAVKDL